MYRKFSLTILCFILSVLLVIALYHFSNVPNAVKNGFQRKFLNNSILLPKNILDVNNSNNYIAGATIGHVYIGNYKIPQEIIASNYNLRDTNHLKITERVLHKEAIKIFVDSPNVFIMDGREAKIIVNKLINSANIDTSTKEFRTIFFGSSLPLNNNSFIAQIVDTNVKINIFSKITFGKSINTINKDILEKQIDGIFCTDGILTSTPNKTHIIYTYLYRNQFIYLDTNLNVISKWNTIDTTTFAKISVKQIGNTKSYTMTAPPIKVNQTCFATDDKLFNLSTLLADNEERREFSKNSVIDVYDLKNGHYQFSFYIPHINDTKISDFYITNDFLIGIHGKYIISYPLGSFLKQ